MKKNGKKVRNKSSGMLTMKRVVAVLAILLIALILLYALWLNTPGINEKPDLPNSLTTSGDYFIFKTSDDFYHLNDRAWGFNTVDGSLQELDIRLLETVEKNDNLNYTPPIENTTPCPGNIMKVSPDKKEFLVTEYWEDARLSPSGELSKSLCIYDAEEKKILLQRNFPLSSQVSNYYKVFFKHGVLVTEQTHYDSNNESTLQIEWYRENTPKIDIPNARISLSEDTFDYFFMKNQLLIEKNFSDPEEARMAIVSLPDGKTLVEVRNYDLLKNANRNFNGDAIHSIRAMPEFDEIVLSTSMNAQQDACWFRVNAMTLSSEKVICRKDFYDRYNRDLDSKEFIVIDMLDRIKIE